MPATDLERVLSLHAAIAAGIEEIDSEQRWTLQGLGATSLLEARLAVLTGDDTWKRLAHASLARAFALLSESTVLLIGLHEGLSGIGWAARLANRCLGPAEQFDVSDADDMVLDYLSSPGAWDGNYDLLAGATGCAVYALGHPDIRRRTEMLEAYVRLLSSRAEPGEHGLFWTTPASILPEWQRRLHPEGHVDLGLAHGIPAVVAMLSRMAMAGFESPEAARLLEGSVAECLAELRIVDREVIGNFRADGATSRCAWCYGEPGLAVALGTAGKALGNRRLRDRARMIFRSSASRSDQSTRQLLDIGLCHGWTGIHLISRYLESLDPGEDAAPSPAEARATAEIRDACDATLARGELPLFEPTAPSGPASDPTFLGGALGVAHALLDTAFPARQDSDLPWADCVLM